MDNRLTTMNWYGYFALGYYFSAEFFCYGHSGCEKAVR